MNNKAFYKLGLGFAALIVFIVMSVACQNRELAVKLDRVEEIIQEHPSVALGIIQSIDTLSLTSRPLEARYSLLLAMTLDKNYIDTTNVEVVMPAVDYYRKHGTADERMKSFYYLGRIQENAGDLNAAAISFSLGENELNNVIDTQMKGLLYMAFADIYNKTKNVEKEEEYVKKGIAAFEEAGDIKHSNLSVGRLAIVYYNKQEWSLADSLFRVGTERAITDTIAMSVFLSNYARMKIVMPEKDPEGAILLLNRMMYSYNRSWSLTDYGVFAYASLLTGNNRDCETIEENFSSLSDQQQSLVSFWRSKIEQFRGNYQKALEYDIQSYAYNTASVSNILSHSVTQTLQDYYKQLAVDVKKDSMIATLRILLVSVSIIILLIAVFLYSKTTQRKKQADIERLLIVSEESNRILHSTQKSLQDKVELYSRQVEEIRMTEAGFKEKLETLRKSYATMYKDKYAALGKLCNTYLETMNRIDKKDIIFRRVENLIAFISDNDKLHMRFENQINRELNDIVKRLKADLGDVDKKDSRFICYCIVGFEPQMISTILGLSLSNVYTKKSRLKDRIRGLNSPYKEEYLRML